VGHADAVTLDAMPRRLPLSNLQENHGMAADRADVQRDKSGAFTETLNPKP